MEGRIYQINIKPKTEDEGGIPKISVKEAYLSINGVDGDYNHFRSTWKLGTLDRAVLIMPFETLKQLEEERWPVKPGDLGENITTHGIPYSEFLIGKRYSVGEAVIKISEICKPCKVLRVLPYVGQNKITDFIKTLEGRRGWYAKVINEGMVRTGDTIREIFI